MMMSSNGNFFRVTDHLCGKFTGHQWIPLTKASDAELWCFLWSAPEYSIIQIRLCLLRWQNVAKNRIDDSWWRHQMETFTALPAICAGNLPVTGEVPSQSPVMRSFDVFFDLRLNKRLSKQWWGWWFEMPSRSLWRQCNVISARWERVQK